MCGGKILQRVVYKTAIATKSPRHEGSLSFLKKFKLLVFSA